MNNGFIRPEYLELLKKLKIKKLPKLTGRADTFTRKYNFVQSFTDLASLENFLFRWEYVFPEYLFDYILNLEFSFLINLEISFDLSLWLDFISTLPEYELAVPAEFNITRYNYSYFQFAGIPYEEYMTKAYFGASRYNYSYFDPPQITIQDLLSYAFDIRNKYLNKIGYEYRFTNEAMKAILETHKDMLRKLNVSEAFINYLHDKILIAESKLRYNTYVNFAVVEFSIVLPSVEGSTGVAVSLIRDKETFEPTVEMENISPVDTVVDYAYVGYVRVTPSREDYYIDYGAQENKQIIPEPIAEAFEKRISRGNLILGKIDIIIDDKVIPYLPQRHRLRLKGKEIVEKGAPHQAIIQSYMNRVETILDKYGVSSNERMLYHAFTKELLYIGKSRSKISKMWKEDVSDEMLIDKYEAMGADFEILNEILYLVKGKRLKVPKWFSERYSYRRRIVVYSNEDIKDAIVTFVFTLETSRKMRNGDVVFVNERHTITYKHFRERDNVNDVTLFHVMMDLKKGKNVVYVYYGSTEKKDDYHTEIFDEIVACDKLKIYVSKHVGAKVIVI